MMPRVLVSFVRLVEKFNYGIGRAVMFGIFVLMGVLLFGAVSRAFWVPQIWTDEMGQFLMVGYFMLGGAYSLQLGSAVRMDVFYERWSPRSKAAIDTVTMLCVLFYLAVLLWGGVESTQYALEYAERKRGLWRPYMAPVKIVMLIGIAMMLLQCTAILIRDVARLRGIEIPGPKGERVA